MKTWVGTVAAHRLALARVALLTMAVISASCIERTGLSFGEHSTSCGECDPGSHICLGDRCFLRCTTDDQCLWGDRCYSFENQNYCDVASPYDFRAPAFTSVHESSGGGLHLRGALVSFGGHSSSSSYKVTPPVR